ncbi:imidazole glycerol phosphate synthase subunit HisH [Halorussus limi]|uniref:Imidazole glycerol phosphate synthase subunit HisH n=1 Tax=Halorussus limi TaxID=2938695 RepID=A0A8U0HUC1_9EURY|nr:imidazole glycerol phosphate synthase subunit HisH [Halorussus limi]UPV74600.1 imidazole glycerol phosphate synthase subunit HisH [Halorussus limi]
MNVTIVDYGVGNLRSLRRGLERADADVEVTDDPEEIADAEAIVLPGVGAFEECMRNSAPFHDALRDAAADTPILGICVGLQLLFTESEEGAPDGVSASESSRGSSDEGSESDGETVEGLDLIPGRVERLPRGEVKVPHMGWNEVTVERDHPLAEGIADGDYAYFVHSYCAAADDHTVASCDYGFSGDGATGESNDAPSGVGFAAVAANEAGNVMGTQFHPEKSGETGLRILQNFVDYARQYREPASEATAD